MLFKEKVKNKFVELIVDSKITFQFSTSEVILLYQPKTFFKEYRENWKMVLSKANQFGNILIEKHGEEEKINLSYSEKAGKMLFTLNLEVMLFVGFEEDLFDSDLDY